MAVDEFIPYPDAHDLAHAEKGFYPVRIPVSHWQLRHYISTPEKDHLYYASGSDIYCLNTATKKRRFIAALPFEARCTASGYGWVCVGGEEDGHFASIKLDGSGQHTLDVDSALPIEGWRPNVGRRAPTVKVERIGEEIVNSISIHRIQDEEAHLDDIVAVLTNNDKTVRIYSLPGGHETKVKDLPFAINHATISPDGRTLVAVGDLNQAYFFTREIVDTPPQIPKPHNRLTSASVDWKLSNVVPLHVSSPDSTVGYFTTAWSPSGHLVAVGSEGGYITVMDTEILANPELHDDESIVAVVPGSRADFATPHPGAIRSMLFSPEPWDLLMWAEDQGRVCVGDLRTGLKSRQIIGLELKDNSLRKLTFEDVPSDDHAMPSNLPHMEDIEAELLRQFQDAPTRAEAAGYATDFIEFRRRQRLRPSHISDLASLRSQAGTPGSSSHTPDLEDPQLGLTAREQQILESLRTSRQREESRANGQVPRSVNYTTPDLFHTPAGRSSASTAANTADSARPISEILSAVQESFPELSRTHAASPGPSTSLAAESSGTSLPPRVPPNGPWEPSGRSVVARSNDDSRLLRRPTSGMFAPPEYQVSFTVNPSSAAPRRSASTAEADDENPWRQIEEEMAITRGPLFESAARESAARAQARASLAAAERWSPESLQQEVDAQRRAQPRVRDRWRTTTGSTTGSTTATTRLAGGNVVTLADARRLAAFPDGYETLMRRTTLRMREREVGVRTAGLALSEDGGTLWAACEDGIFEVSVRRKERLFLPALEVR